MYVAVGKTRQIMTMSENKLYNRVMKFSTMENTQDLHCEALRRWLRHCRLRRSRWRRRLRTRWACPRPRGSRRPRPVSSVRFRAPRSLRWRSWAKSSRNQQNRLPRLRPPMRFNSHGKNRLQHVYRRGVSKYSATWWCGCTVSWQFRIYTE